MIGFHCSHEQHAPSALLRYAQLAARAGFKHAMCSDHFAPWIRRQGHSGFTWSWLGAALQATPLTFGTVCAPGQRYHPAIIAQATATLAEMYPERFWVTLGSGEALNEAITGEAWPAKDERNARLLECARIMRALWAGETVTHRGHVVVENARLYDRPPQPPLLLGAALTAETARWVGTWADGLATVATARDEMQQVIDAFRETGGAKPIFLQVALAFAPTDAEARAAAVDQWRQVVVSGDGLADLASPEDFEHHSAHATPEAVSKGVRISSDVDRHLEWLHEDAAMGYARIYVHNVARDHLDRFIGVWAERVLPNFA